VDPVDRRDHADASRADFAVQGHPLELGFQQVLERVCCVHVHNQSRALLTCSNLLPGPLRIDGVRPGQRWCSGDARGNQGSEALATPSLPCVGGAHCGVTHAILELMS
jgi:uncharacterized protein (DUF2237 family)